MSSSKGSFQLMKSLNKSLILNVIRQEKQISRAEIAKKTRLTPPTVTNIVNELLEVGLVKESTMGVSKGGRKPILLTIDEKHSYIVGVDVGGHKLRAILTDLNGNNLVHYSQELPKNLTNDFFLRVLTDAIDKVLADSHIPIDKVIGIGVGMHGIVDSEKGISIFAPNFQLEQIPIKKHIERNFSLPVIVENDARAFALGEKWFGQGLEHSTIMCVNVGVGIGAGIILDGKLYRGHNSLAGEIGHTMIDINGKLCTCGNEGCLQTVVGGDRLIERTIEKLKKGQNSILQNNKNLTGYDIHQAAIQNDPLAVEVLRETGTYLGIALTNFIHLFNPSRIIIGGGVANSGDFIMKPLIHCVKERALTIEAKSTEIVRSNLGEYGTAIGAVTLILETIFAVKDD
ncbi:ROK family transcriptional regulator [Alkalihalobacillus trypoxylicola]|nr:ROK family transcriptional regulator [Alkalihalobacillus trypoxylicola]